MKLEEIKNLQHSESPIETIQQTNSQESFINQTVANIGISGDDLIAFIVGAVPVLLIIIYMFFKTVIKKYINLKNFERMKSSKWFGYLKKEKIKIIIGLILLFIIFSLYSSYSTNNEIEKNCKLQIDYRIKYFKYKDKGFETKEDAMEYCKLTEEIKRK